MVRRLMPLLCLMLLAGCSSPPAAHTQPGIVVINADGTDLATAVAAMPPTLGLTITADIPLTSTGVSVRVDGRAADVTFSDGNAAARVAPLALGSQHQLDVVVDSEVNYDSSFTVVTAAAVVAAVHQDGDGKHLDLDLSFSLAPTQSALSTALDGASIHWTSPTTVQARWLLGANPPSVTIPADLPVTDGSRMAGALTVSLTPPVLGTLRRVSEPPAPTGAALPITAFAVSTAKSHASAQAHSGALSVLSPAGVEVTSSGELSGVPDTIDTAAGQSAGIAVMPLIANDDSNATQTHALISNAGARSQLASSVVSLCVTGHFAGVELDIEAISPTDEAGYTALVQTVSAALHAHGLRLSVDVVPAKPGGLNVYSAAYNVPAIARAADSVVLMAYDEDDANSGAGPVAGLDWDEQLLAGSANGVSPAKLVLGMPLYGASWTGQEGETDSYSDLVENAIEVPGAEVEYDFPAQTPFIVDTPAGGSQQLTYFDDAQSLAYKVELAREHHLAGIAVWRLGFEDPSWWSDPGAS